MEALMLFVVKPFLRGIRNLFVLDANFQVRKSLRIDLPKGEVFNAISNFRTWANWSPWLMHEPEAKIIYEAPGDDFLGAYSWEGKKIGAGRLSQTERKGADEIAMRIDFLKPFKSSSVVRFELSEKEGGTEVCWIMEGKMPFFFKPMIPGLIEQIGMDYEIGLNFLNRTLDPNAKSFSIEFKGPATLDGKNLVGDFFKGTVEELSDQVSEIFERAAKRLGKKKCETENGGETVITKMNPETMFFEGFAGLPDSSGLSGNPPFKTFRRETGLFAQTVVTGDYSFIRLGWHAAFANLRMSKLKYDHRRISMEQCLISPYQTKNPNEYKTVICIPVKPE